MTPLHIATEYGHNSIVESLIKCGANINAVDVVSNNVDRLITLHHIVCVLLFRINELAIRIELLITVHQIFLFYHLESMDSVTLCFTRWS